MKRDCIFLSKIDDGLASSFGNMAIVSFDLDMKTIMEYLFGSVHTWFRTRAKSTLPSPPWSGSADILQTNTLQL